MKNVTFELINENKISCTIDDETFIGDVINGSKANTSFIAWNPHTSVLDKINRAFNCNSVKEWLHKFYGIDVYKCQGFWPETEHFTTKKIIRTICRNIINIELL